MVGHTTITELGLKRRLKTRRPFLDLKSKRVGFPSVMHFEGRGKGAGPAGILFLILKNCASVFARPFSLLFNRSLSTCVFLDRWKLSYVTPILKKGRRNNVEDYRGVVLLVYRTMHDDLKNLIPVNQHGFMKNRSKVTNSLEYAFFVLNSIEEGWQVDSVYTDFLKAFDREKG
jgi:hypothetical protein